MNDEEKINFGNMLTGISELYSKKMSGQLLEIYWQTLKKYSLEELTHAVTLHVLNSDNGQFMPKPADILRYIEGKNVDRALGAWTSVTFAIKQVGSYESISFNDPLIHAVIHEMGGWIELCHTREDRMPFVAQEFQKRYCSYLTHKPKGFPKYLSGILEHQNNLYGYHTPEPVLFDDKKMNAYLTDFNLNPEESSND